MIEGSRNPGPASLRRCVAERTVRPAAEMVRFVLGGDGCLRADVDGRRGGRGLWLSARRDVVKTACAKGLFAKAARRRVSVSADLGDEVEELLVRRCLDLVGLARRAGQAAAGYDAASAWVDAGKAGVLLVARDAPAKVPEQELPSFDLFSRAELGTALGLDAADCVAVAAGRMAGRLIAEGRRLAGFREIGDR